MSLIAARPPMGWNSWNTFSCDINEKLIKEVVETFIKDGFRDAGYTIIALDDGWHSHERDENGRLTPDPEKFPNGMKALGDFLHSNGLKFGIYSCAGTMTCAGYPGSYGYEQIDAQTFAQWGVDLLKYDYCFAPAGSSDVVNYRRMGQALRETGRDIIFSACWGTDGVWKWARSTGAHMWRLTGDISDSWESIESVGFGDVGLEAYAGPGGWNDPDMMVVGLNGQGYVGKIGGGCSFEEYKSHFTLWCILAAPLIMGNDVRTASPETKEILLNKEAIEVNQDEAGIQGFKIPGMVDVIAKPLSDGSIAISVFNKTNQYRLSYSVPWDILGWEVTDSVQARDLWQHKDIGIFKHAITVAAEPHGCAFIKLKRMKQIKNP
jgi:alpha-galactosidase